MHARSLLIAAAALTIASIAAAEPAKPEAAKANTTGGRPAAVVLASAEQVQAPIPAAQNSDAIPVKPVRRGRVTTCRCGGQTTAQH